MQREAKLWIGDEDVTIKPPGKSALRSGKILGREIRGGVESIYLDRLIAKANQYVLPDEWVLEGCISTILQRPIKKTGISVQFRS